MHWGNSLPSLECRRIDAPTLWLVGGLFYGVGDVLLTWFGLGVVGVVEANPVVASLTEQNALAAMSALKAATFGGAYVVWKLVPHPQRVGIPLGLAALGVSVTAWNLHVLVFALVL